MVEMEYWFNDTMDKFIDEYVLGRNTHATNRIQIDTEEMIVTPLRLLLLNGSISSLHPKTRKRYQCCQRLIMKRVKALCS